MHPGNRGTRRAPSHRLLEPPGQVPGDKSSGESGRERVRVKCVPGNQKRGAYSIYRDEEDLEFKDGVIKRGIWLGIPLRQGYEGCFI